jgi:hypothetical protein
MQQFDKKKYKDDNKNNNFTNTWNKIKYKKGTFKNHFRT